MRDREIKAFKNKHPDYPDLVAKWRAGHPAATLRDAVTDLGLWHNPDDHDMQWHIWCVLKDIGDPAAAGGFPAMRAAAVAAGEEEPC